MVRALHNLILRSCFEEKDPQKQHTDDLLLSLYSPIQLAGTMYEDNGLSVILWMDSYTASSRVVTSWLQEESFQKALV